MSSSSSYSNPPCAACKFLRRKCLPGCVFAPYFPPEEPQKFANVHKIFGASNVSKLLNEIQPHQREDAVNSLAYEAEARLKDPVYGCVGAISVLQSQVLRLQKELEATNADLMRFSSGYPAGNPTSADANVSHPVFGQQRSGSNNMNQVYGRSRIGGYGRIVYPQSHGMVDYYSSAWSNSSSGEHNPDLADADCSI